jgi:ABC-2 type transport system ATP-binding protein
MSVIEVSQLTKVFKIPKKDPGLSGAVRSLFRPQFERKTAVDHISFSMEQGEIVGYIGVNGAGKSTTIKMLTGVLLPTSGTARILGRDPHRQRIENARQVGVVFGQRTQLWWDLALIESLNLIARIYEVPAPRYKAMLDQFTETLDLKDLLKVPVRNMSLGQKMRSELAAALIHEPRVVYLDEPTIGLDLLVKERIRDFIRRQCASTGMTVMLTTHDLGDIEELCQRVLMIDEGRIIYDGPITAIRDRFGKFREITFETEGNPPAALALPHGAEIIASEDRSLRVRFDRTATSASQVASSVMEQIEVCDFSLSEPDLASIVKQIYNGALDTV